MVGIIHQIQNSSAAARKWYERALAINSRSAVAANNLAWLYVEEGGNLDMAMQLALVAHGENPEVPEYADTLGWVFYKKGLFAQAAELFEQSSRRDPANAVYSYHLGLAHLRGGNSERARRAFELALKAAPHFEGAEEARRALQSLNP
jgi:Tfp pilus assembly protein PilF